ADCPTCQGVWLARPELDKIIDRSVRGDSLTTCPHQHRLPISRGNTKVGTAATANEVAVMAEGMALFWGASSTDPHT
ncbi:zf-TFIIB domain-containing protein, partial [Escherichia coli]|uniref:zf-TFIIB domain-containing protein n=1 Tax=Escherichia coli TaxID=562 RepID=UPI0034D95AFF